MEFIYQREQRLADAEDRKWSQAIWKVAQRHNEESVLRNGAVTCVRRTGKRRDSEMVGLS